MPGPRDYTDATIKKLFALSYNLCAFPGCERVLFDPRWERVGADICHIVGAEPDGPRYDPGVPVDFLRSYENLLLLCKSCHHHIDYERPSDFPVERLFQIKAAAERPRERALPVELVYQFVDVLRLSLYIEPPMQSLPLNVSPWRWSPLIELLEHELDDGLAIHRPTARAILEAEYGGSDFEYLTVDQLDEDDITTALATLRQAQAIGYADRHYLPDDDRTLTELNVADTQS